MTNEQINELSDLTNEASSKNDIDSLLEIYTLLQNTIKLDINQFGTLGLEWFSSSLTGLQWIEVLTRYNENQSN